MYDLAKLLATVTIRAGGLIEIETEEVARKPPPPDLTGATMYGPALPDVSPAANWDDLGRW